ncbi:hypothetical protein [Paraburkholderia guartelaensis]|uniref:Uncharacterized protein n=1 Tax=Paraburkholderia guartelaensis TaxID=2546446 RepID=A0ABU9SQ57_9BURK
MKDLKLEKASIDLSRISKGIAAGATVLAKAGEFLSTKKTEAVASVLGASVGMLLAFIVCSSIDASNPVLYAGVWLTGLVGFSAGGLFCRAVSRSSTASQIHTLEQQLLLSAQQFDRTPPSNELTRAVLLNRVIAQEELLPLLRSRWLNFTPARNRRSKAGAAALRDGTQTQQNTSDAGAVNILVPPPQNAYSASDKLSQ